MYRTSQGICSAGECLEVERDSLFTKGPQAGTKEIEKTRFHRILEHGKRDI